MILMEKFSDSLIFRNFLLRDAITQTVSSCFIKRWLIDLIRLRIIADVYSSKIYEKFLQ